MGFKSTRTSIKVDSSQVEALADLHLGAFSLLMTMQSADPMGFMIATALHIDDMNMRGEQIWQAFRWACTKAPDGDAAGPFFVAAINRRDPEMVAYVNQALPLPAGEVAVVSGASHARLWNQNRKRRGK